MNRQKYERLPDEYRKSGAVQTHRGGRYEVYTDFSLHGQLMPLDPDVVSRINGRLI